jgi:hypothetical protein
VKIKIYMLILFLVSQPSIAAPNIPLQKDVEPPTLLSQTGILPLSANGFRTYEIIQPLWVDYAQKERMVYLPDNTKVTFTESGPYVFPVGTIFVKHFRMEISQGIFQNIETRVLVRKVGEAEQNWVGYTYQWDGNDAHLVANQLSPKVIINVDATSPGGARAQEFGIPSRMQCMQCHNSSVGFVRSFDTFQLNRLVGAENQLMQFNKAGIFDRDVGDIQRLGKFANISDESESLESRTKSYLDVNCSHCHNPSPEAMCNFTDMDFRYANFSVNALIESAHIVKGVSTESEIIKRMDSEQRRFRMPFIGTVLRDESAVNVIKKWIDQL